MTVVLTAKQIEDLAAFAKEDGQPHNTPSPLYNPGIRSG